MTPLCVSSATLTDIQKTLDKTLLLVYRNHKHLILKLLAAIYAGYSGPNAIGSLAGLNLAKRRVDEHGQGFDKSKMRSGWLRCGRSSPSHLALGDFPKGYNNLSVIRRHQRLGSF